jgi:hypothetical protein
MFDSLDDPLLIVLTASDGDAYCAWLVARDEH